MSEQKLIFTWSGVLLLLVFIASLVLSSRAEAQNKSAITVKVGQVFQTFYDPGYGSPTTISSGYFPEDFDCYGYNDDPGATLYFTNWDTAEAAPPIEKVGFSASTVYNPDGTVIDYLQGYVRYPYAESVVNEEVLTPAQLGEVNPDELVGTSDQTITQKYRYACGVDLTRTAFAWSRKAHDNYVVIDYMFEHVGDQPLDSLYIAINDGGWCCPNFQQAWGFSPGPSGIEGHAFDQCRWYHYYGGRPGDSLRVYYNYRADDPKTTGDNMGWPAVEQEGRLIRTDFAFHGILHANGEPFTNSADDVNDPMQPIGSWAGYGEALNIGGFEQSVEAPNAYDYHSGKLGRENPMPGRYPGSDHRQNNDEVGSPDFTALGTGMVYRGSGHTSHLDFGPYNFNNGEKIHIVLVRGVHGLSHRKAKEIGRKWLNGTLDPPPDLPDPQTGYFPDNFQYPPEATQMDINKDLWVSSGVDSVHTAMSRAKWNFEHDWQIPVSPPPPSMLHVTGYPDYAQIKWSDTEAEQLDNFAGYRIYRRTGQLDTNYFELIGTVPGDQKAEEHTFEDRSIKFGAAYSYYVQAGVQVDENDLNAVASVRGDTIWSGRMITPSLSPVNPPRAGTESLSDVRIAPNPYNINDPLLEGYGWIDFRGLLFFNLPPQVTIKIFTENGDLVKTIEHDSPVRAGSLHWDMLSDSQQVIASGVYIAVFEKDNGDLAYEKFVVVR